MPNTGTLFRQIIKYAETPTCKQCLYFKPHATQILLGKCIKFGEKHLISGKITFMYANEARNIEQLCGQKGLYYLKPKEPEKALSTNNPE